MSRNRDLFPMPLPFGSETGVKKTLSRGTRRRILGTQHRMLWANDAVRTLNDLTGCSSQEPSLVPVNGAQEEAVTFLKESFLQIPNPDPSITPAGAFEALCGKMTPYGEQSGTIVNYGPDASVSWPELGCSARPLEELLAEADSNMVCGPNPSLLRSASDAVRMTSESGINRPYVDPAFRSPRVYAKFLLDAHARGLLEWHFETDSLVGVFFVRKRDGRLRLILDTRLCICKFQPPWGPSPHGCCPRAHRTDWWSTNLFLWRRCSRLLFSF